MKVERSAGVDISKNSLEMAVYPTGEHVEVANDEEGVGDLVEALEDAQVDIVVLEATGGLELPLALSLGEASLPVAVVNPRQVRRFAEAKALQAKTDRLDAEVIAEFGAKIEVEIRPLPTEAMVSLRELARRRRQVMKMIGQERNRLGQAHCEQMKKQIERHIQFLMNERDDIDRAAREEIENTPMWKAKNDLLETIPAFGKATATTLLSRMPELGQMSGKEAGSLVGVAPYNNDSGELEGHRSISGGRKDVRAALYMPTLAATRHNPVIRRTYQRLLDNGKEKQVAVIACMRKLVVFANAMLRDGVPWDPPEVASLP